jgi:hypothetical protein
MTRQYQVCVTLRTQVQIEMDQYLTDDPSPEQRIACWEAVGKVIGETEVNEADMRDILVLVPEQPGGCDYFTACAAEIREAREWLAAKHA